MNIWKRVRTAALLGSALLARGAEPQDVSFTASSDGTTQHYALMLPDGFDGSKPHSLLVALHSYGGDRWQCLQTKYPTMKAALEAAAKWRMIIASPEYRGKTSWMGPKAESDVLQMISEIKTHYHIGKVFICGTSMGGTGALTFVARHPELVDGVVAMNALANHLEFDTAEGLAKVIQESFGGTKQQIPLEYKRRSAEYWPERFTMPLALTAGAKDTLLPPASVARLADVVRKIGGQVLYICPADQGHNTTYEDARTAFEFVLNRAL
jgi:pimeloyl-ACP methyl ester carboxylesterase